jgi:hypothetical protein
LPEFERVQLRAEFHGRANAVFGQLGLGGSIRGSRDLHGFRGLVVTFAASLKAAPEQAPTA